MDGTSLTWTFLRVYQFSGLLSEAKLYGWVFFRGKEWNASKQKEMSLVFAWMIFCSKIEVVKYCDYIMFFFRLDNIYSLCLAASSFVWNCRKFRLINNVPQSTANFLLSPSHTSYYLFYIPCAIFICGTCTPTCVQSMQQFNVNTTQKRVSLTLEWGHRVKTLLIHLAKA